MANQLWLNKGNPLLIYALILVAALTGAVGEGDRRLDEVGQWRRAPAALRDGLLYGPYREVFSVAESGLSPTASVLLYSDWDPALLPYYLYPRKIYQIDVDPETNHSFMKLPPSSYPRRRPENFAVDWVIGLRDMNGIMVPEFREAGRP